MIWLSTFTVWLTLRVAVALMLPFIVTVQTLSPEQAPLQPAKNDPWAAATVSLTFVPEAKAALQVGLQLIPAGVLVTVPEPVPATVTLSV
jgi:hypothetical protein